MTFHRAHLTPNPRLNTRPLPPGLRERLRREHGWSELFAAGAEDEYRRFVYLASSGQAVTPSPAVDAVWHAHLMFTRDYWGEFQGVLGAPLHHEPGTGAPGDAAHFQAQYLGTLALYARTFGEAPPAAYWPRPQTPDQRAQATRTPRGRTGGGWAALAILGGTALALGLRAVVVLSVLALGLLGVALLRALRRSRPHARRPHDSGDSGGLLAIFGLDLGSGGGGCPDDSGGDGGSNAGGGCGGTGGGDGGSSCGSGCGGAGCGS